jgi:hypothetical protein
MYQSTPVQWIDAGEVVNCRDIDSYTKTSIHCRYMQVHSSKTRGQHAFPSLSALPTPLEYFLLLLAVHGTGINAMRDGRCWRRRDLRLVQV